MTKRTCSLRKRAARLLPHEWFFGGFLLCQGIRLGLAAGPADHDTLTYLALLLANIGIIAACERRESAARWHARLAFYPIAMNLVFFSLGPAVLKLSPVPCDPALRAIDEFIFGSLLSVRAQALTTPALTEVMSAGYLVLFPYLIVSWLHSAWRGVPCLRGLSVGLFSIYGLGFLGYALLPAAGPHLAYPELFDRPLVGGPVAAFNSFVVARGSNGVDVFPSLHCALTGYLLWFDRRHAPIRFRLLLGPCLVLWLATLYLRYHYFADVAAGAALAAGACWLTARWEDSAHRRAPVHPTP